MVHVQKVIHFLFSVVTEGKIRVSGYKFQGKKVLSKGEDGGAEGGEQVARSFQSLRGQTWILFCMVKAVGKIAGLAGQRVAT